MKLNNNNNNKKLFTKRKGQEEEILLQFNETRKTLWSIVSILFDWWRRRRRRQWSINKKKPHYYHLNIIIVIIERVREREQTEFEINFLILFAYFNTIAIESIHPSSSHSVPNDCYDQYRRGEYIVCVCVHRVVERLREKKQEYTDTQYKDWHEREREAKAH